MIVLNSIGGLGNQMFEYAYARMLQEKYNEKLVIDISGYDSYKIREFSLSNLNLNDNIQITKKVDIKFGERIKYNISKRVYRIFQKLMKLINRNQKIGVKSFERLSKMGFYFNHDVYFYNSVLSNVKNKYVYGYFQSIKYFESIEDKLKYELRVKILPNDKELLIIDKIKNSNSIGVSIRWGKDYKTTDLYVCEKEFFYKAMDCMAEKTKNPKFFIFSDTPELIKEEFKFKYNVEFIQGMNDYQSLRLLYNCKNFIISNSSFSWFGAYLSENKGKIIIAPKKWYKKDEVIADIYTEDMIKM